MKRTSLAQKTTIATYVRTFVFGVEDSLASTVGLLAGIASSEVPRSTIFLTGVVLIFVEAISMSAGSFLSERSAENYMTKSERTDKVPSIEALIMFCSYIVSGLIPLAPYLLIPGDGAFVWSIVVSLIALAALGLVSAWLSKTSKGKSMFRMLVIGGLAIAVGIAVGRVVGI